MDLEDLRLARVRLVPSDRPRADPSPMLADRQLATSEADVVAGLTEPRRPAPHRARRRRLDRDGPSVRLDQPRVLGHGRADALVGRLCVGFVRAGPPAPGGAERPGRDPVPKLRHPRRLGRGPRGTARGRLAGPLPRAGCTDLGRRRPHVRQPAPVLLARRVSMPGSPEPGTSSATSWTSTRSGASPAAGTRVAWTAATSGATRRTAKDYFRSVGLVGPFWGT